MSDSAGRRVSVGLDPGGTSGWAVVIADGDEVVPEEGWLVDVGQVGSDDSTDAHGAWYADARAARVIYEAVGNVVRHYGPVDVLAIEDFILRPGRATAARGMLSPVRVASAFIALATEDEWAEWSGEPSKITFTTPSAAKTVCNDERLKSWGLWTVGMAHGRDATRHAVLGHRVGQAAGA